MIARAPRTSRRRGFSLIELLMAIFILSLGIISIAALFPAGMVQQQQSVDDIMGPIVANSALSIVRSKVRPEYFGRFEDFTPGSSAVPLRPPRFSDVQPLLQESRARTSRRFRTAAGELWSTR